MKWIASPLGADSHQFALLCRETHWEARKHANAVPGSNTWQDMWHGVLAIREGLKTLLKSIDSDRHSAQGCLGNPAGSKEGVLLQLLPCKADSLIEAAIPHIELDQRQFTSGLQVDEKGVINIPHST